MKATIFFWACNNFEEQTGYTHQQEVPVEDVFNIMAFIFGTGLNVMLHHTTADHITIFVDDKRFGQR